MKKYLCLLLAIVLLPFGVYAEDDPGLPEKLEQALGGNHKIVITDKTLGNNYLLGTPNEPEPTSDFDGFTRFASAYIKNMPEVKQFLKDYSNYHPRIDVYCRTHEHCGIKVSYDFDARGECSSTEYEELVQNGYQYPGCFYTDYEIELKNIVTDYNQDVYNNTIPSIFAKDNVGGFPHNYYYLYDLAYINQLYNQNFGDRSLLNEADRNAYYELLATSFPEINDVTDNHPEFTQKYAGISSMGSSSNDSNVLLEYPVDYITYYNDVAYRITTSTFLYAPILFVEDTTPDDKLIEAAKARIESYLNDSKTKVVIDDITPTFSNEALTRIYDELNSYLTAIGSTASANSETRVYSLKIGATTSEKNLFIFKTPKSNIKALELQAIEKSTGIRFFSTASIPSDALFDVQDVTEAYRKLNKSVEEAYDIKLFSYSASSYIKSVAGGMKIYIPVSKEFKKDGKKISYLDKNGKILENFDITLETVDGKTYATFVTDHLSVYALTDDSMQIDVPDTLKNISLALVCVMLVLGVAGGCIILSNKKRKNN